MKGGMRDGTQIRFHMTGLYIVHALDIEMMAFGNSYLRSVTEEEKTTMIVSER